MPTALDVAQFFIAKCASSDEGGITNLKLQKLAYYAQGFHLAVYGRALFEEEIEAWTHGPVVPDLYHHYKTKGSNPIMEVEYDSSDKFSAEQIDFLEEVHDVFGQFSAWKLRNMTHEEAPWLEHEADASVIPKPVMKEYFQSRVA